MRFSHRSTEGWTFDPERTYDQYDAMKPRGLWLSVDGDWERWLDEWGYRDDERWGTSTTFFRVDLDRCLVIDTTDKIDAFSLAYIKKNQHAGSFMLLDWEPLSKMSAGLVIAPYLWHRRLHEDTGWYYGWDCASACIWDLSVLEVTDGS